MDHTIPIVNVRTIFGNTPPLGYRTDADRLFSETGAIITTAAHDQICLPVLTVVTTASLQQHRCTKPLLLTCDLLPRVDSTQADLSIVLHPPAEVLFKHSRLGVLHHPLHLPPGQDRAGQIRARHVSSGQVRSGQVRSGQDRAGQGRQAKPLARRIRCSAVKNKRRLTARVLKSSRRTTTKTQPLLTLVQAGRPFCAMNLLALSMAAVFSALVLPRPIHTKKPAAPVSRMKQS